MACTSLLCFDVCAPPCFRRLSHHAGILWMWSHVSVSSNLNANFIKVVVMVLRFLVSFE